MRLVTVRPSGEVKMVVGWLPTCLGLNLSLQAQLQAKLQSLVGPLPLSDEQLTELSVAAIDLICERFPTVQGLRALLFATLEVTLEGHGG